MKCIPYERKPFVDKLPRAFQHKSAPKLDAIFVPTRRTGGAFRRQLEALASLTELLFVLPTGPAFQSFRSKDTLPPNVRIVSNDTITDIHRRFLIRSSSQNPSRVISQTYDLPAKRNLSLHLARSYGFRRICLLDDDITITESQVVSATAALSKSSPMSGFYVFDFPDVSTIDHIHRMVTNDPSETLPGGNCLFMLLDSIEGFFPYTYNEDWIFVLHNSTRQTGYVLGEVKQEAHAPWLDTNRVRFEEFGEAIISGLLPLSGVINAPEAASADYWATICKERREWLAELFEMCHDSLYRRTVQTAAECLERFVPRDFVQFILAVKNELNDHLWIPNIRRTL
jgi:hypothetical protein